MFGDKGTTINKKNKKQMSLDRWVIRHKKPLVQEPIPEIAIEVDLPEHGDARTQEKVDAVQQQLETMRRQLAESQRELANAKSQLADVKSQLADARRSCEEVKQEKENLEKRCAEFEAKMELMVGAAQHEVEVFNHRFFDRREYLDWIVEHGLLEGLRRILFDPIHPERHVVLAWNSREAMQRDKRGFYAVDARGMAESILTLLTSSLQAMSDHPVIKQLSQLSGAAYDQTLDEILRLCVRETVKFKRERHADPSK